jgi:hypothetical protein
MSGVDLKISPSHVARLMGAWLLLLLLGAVEFALSFLSIGHALRPLIMVPGVLMVVVVAVTFMEVREGPTIVRAFAVAAAFWLLVLLILGSADPFTRTDNYTISPENPRVAQFGRCYPRAKCGTFSCTLYRKY